MTGFEVALWGLFGGFAVEGLDLYIAIRRRGCWPWQTGKPREASPLAYVVAEVVRLAIGAGLAVAAATSGQVTTPIAALAVGIAAPLIVERLARTIPIDTKLADAEVANRPLVRGTQPPGPAPDAASPTVQAGR